MNFYSFDVSANGMVKSTLDMKEQKEKVINGLFMVSKTSSVLKIFFITCLKYNMPKIKFSDVNENLFVNEF
jgi:hypothetical protein